MTVVMVMAMVEVPFLFLCFISANDAIIIIIFWYGMEELFDIQYPDAVSDGF